MKTACTLEQNVGRVDQVIRLALGVALLAVPVVLRWPTWIIAILSAVGGAQILEGVIRY